MPTIFHHLKKNNKTYILIFLKKKTLLGWLLCRKSKSICREVYSHGFLMCMSVFWERVAGEAFSAFIIKLILSFFIFLCVQKGKENFPTHTCNFGCRVSIATVDFWFIHATCCSTIRNENPLGLNDSFIIVFACSKF